MWHILLTLLFLPFSSSVIVLGDPPIAQVDDIISSLTLQSGANATLECKIDNADSIRWQKDTHGTDVLSRIYSLSGHRDSAGEYRCVGTNAFGSVLSPSVNVDVDYFYNIEEPNSQTEYHISAPIGGFFNLKRPNWQHNPRLSLDFSWYKGDSQVHLNATHYVTARGDLIITDVAGWTFGSYKVLVFAAESSSLEEFMSADYTVFESSEESAPGILSVLAAPENTTLHLGNQITKSSFDCVTSLSSGVTTRWFLDGRPLVSQPGVTLVFENRRVTLSTPFIRTYAKGNHRLECKVSAHAGRLFDQVSASIEILDIPKIKSLPEKTYATIGRSVTLYCSEELKLDATVFKWYFNGEIISNGDRLDIPSVSDAQYGVYQCEARNSIGSSLATTWLREGDATRNLPMMPEMALWRDENPSQRSVPGRPESSSEPTFIEVPQDESVQLGTERYLIRCAVSGDPKPNIVWKFEDELIRTDADKYEQSGEGLILKNIQRSDSGIYTCVARNVHGTHSESAHITVTSGSFIEKAPTNQSMLIGTTLDIPCSVYATYRKQAKIDWYLNDMSIPPHGNPGLRLMRTSNGSLQIGQVGPDSIGEYRCTVTVGSKSENASMWLEIIEKPSMPTGVSATLVNDTLPAKIRISWVEGFDGNSAIIRYMIQMRTFGATELWSDWETVGETDPSEYCCSFLLDNLKPSVTAEFRVIAANKHGPGKPSQPSAAVTMPQQPPAAAPKNVAASARSANSIIVQWQKPQDELFSGDIMGYVIRYRLAGYTLPWIEKNVTTRDARNAVIDQLITWREYELQVAAYNERGLGVFSKSIDVTTAEGVPTQAPKDLQLKVLNSTAVAISFKAPDQQRIPGVNLGYKIQFWQGLPEDGTMFKQVVVDPSSNVLRVVVDGLEKYGHYNASVLCYTSPGDGPRSNSIHFETEQDVPGPVTSLTVQEVMFDGAFVTWESPRSPNGIITRYVLRYWGDSSPEAKTSMELTGDQRNATITGLQSTTKYSLDLLASTIIGDGPREESKFESGRPPVLPERATGLSVSDVQSRSVSLQFVPGFDGYTSIRQWIVEARVADSGVFHVIFNISAPKARSFTITGLRPFTQYQLRLIPENVKGRGAPSEPSRAFETKQTNPEPLATSLLAEPISARAVSLSWTPLLATQWNGQPKGYLILYREQGQDEWKEVRSSLLRASEFTLSDLEPFTAYEIDLFAENMFGRSTSAGLALSRTYESVPSVAPRNVRADSEGIRGAHIRWEAVDDESASGEIIGYTVRLVPEAEWLRTDETKIIDVADSMILQTKVSGLRAFTTYHVFVSAYTIVGNGPENSIATIVSTDEDLPGAPSGVSFSLVSEDEVRLKWLPPENPNGKIKGYTVSYWLSSESSANAHQMPIQSSDLGGFSVGNLQRNTKYIFAISAETSVGVGPETQVSVYTSSVRVPMANPPVALRDERSAASSNEVSIRWDQTPGIEDEEAPIRFVQVEYQKANDDNWTSLERTIGGDKGGVTVTRLAANSAYRFRLRFVGDFSQSVWSAESDWMRTLPSAPSSAPTSLHPTPADSSSLILQWNTPSRISWNADAIGYRILYREYPSKGNSTWRSEDVPAASDRPDKEQHTLHRLASFRHYIVRMTTFNSEGESTFSSPVFVYVGYSIPKRNISNLVAEPKSSTSIAIRWDPWVEEESDVISGFKVRFVPVTSVLSESSHDEEVMVVENNTCLIVDLLKYTQYQISVSAYNRAGEGAVSQLRLRTLEDVPGPVSNLRFTDVLLDSVKVIWDEPQQPNGNVTKYIINYRTFKMQAAFKREHQSQTDHLFYPATKLEEGGEYLFTVWAETAAGRGTEATANITVGPNPKGPSSPSRPAVVPGQSSVTLAWKDAENDDVIGHLIQAKRLSTILPATQQGYSPFTTGPNAKPNRVVRSSDFNIPHVFGEWITLKIVDGSAQKLEISYRELEPSSNYVFRVYARNANGVGQASPQTDELSVPASIPDDPFYTTWWFIGLVAMSTFVVVVVVIAFLCVTGSEARFKRDKRNSADSLQLADGNFVTFQMKGNQRQMGRSRNDLLTRPGTTQSWLSDRDPPAYGSVLAVDRESATGGSVVNMYGLATDVIPQPPNQQALQRLSQLVGRDVRGTGSAYVMGGMRRGSGDTAAHSDYGGVYANRSEYGYASRGDYAPRASGANSRQMEYEHDSFDEEEESIDGGDDIITGQPQHNLADHYAHSDHYRDTWRRVRDTEGVRAPLPPGGLPSSAGSGAPQAESPVASSESTWPSQQAPALNSGFSSFV